eukprot:132120-Rhodomonas_salina.1
MVGQVPRPLSLTNYAPGTNEAVQTSVWSCTSVSRPGTDGGYICLGLVLMMYLSLGLVLMVGTSVPGHHLGAAAAERDAPPRT